MAASNCFAIWYGEAASTVVTLAEKGPFSSQRYAPLVNDTSFPAIVMVALGGPPPALLAVPFYLSSRK